MHTPLKKTVFITGIAGFIGYHLAKALTLRGDIVIGLDNFNSYYSPSLKRLRAKNLTDMGVEIFEEDIRNISSLKPLFEKHSFTHLVNLAAQAGVRYSLTNPHTYLESNVNGFLEILELCRFFPNMKLVYASSSSVYGTNNTIPFSENDPLTHPASLYAATKISNELMAYSYHHLYKISTTGLRFFTVYGPYGRPDMAYFSFAKAIKEGKPIQVFNHGNMRRDFTYIDDIVDGCIKAIDLGAPCEIFNLGNNKAEPLSNLIAFLEKNLKKKAQLEMKPMQPGDVLETFADISKSQNLLGFQPKVSLEEGIERFVSWFDKCNTTS